MSNSTPVLTLHAYLTTEYSPVAGLPQMFQFTAELPSPTEAVEFGRMFPKSAKVIGMTLTTATGERRGWAVAEGNLVSNGVNGGVNEAGLKRYHAIVKAAGKLGIEIQYTTDAGNSYPSREAFEAAIS
jgi:hypothetical protein